MRRINFLLFLIVIVAFFFRLWQVTKVPPSLYWDEVSQGYNAYSILKTGKDEHQEFLPIARFQAFGDYKAPVYIYLDVPFIALFGKTDLAVRLPSILFGSLTVLLVYFLAQELFSTNKWKKNVGLIAAFFLAISPWHVQLSRAAFEANIATFFTVLAVTLFFYSLRKNSWMFVASSFSFVIAIYSFNSHRIFIPLLLVLFAFIERKALFSMKKQAVSSFLIGFIILAPFLMYLKTPESKLRFQEVNIFSNVEIVKESNKLIAEDHDSLLATIIHNRRVLFAREYIKHYFDFFNPDYLFFKGDVNPRFSDRDNGELFIWMLPLLIVGVYSLLLEKRKTASILIGWFLLAPVAAATARETPHALRSETFIPTYEIIAALGISVLFIFFKNHLTRYLRLVLIAFIFIVLLSVTGFWHNYLVHNPISYSYDWQYGYKQTIQEVKKIENQYDKIYFTNEYGRAYIYVAWYANMEPEAFWKEVDMRKDANGLYNVPKLGKYNFTNTPSVIVNEKALYVTSPSTIPSHVQILSTINFLNGKPAFVISKNL